MKLSTELKQNYLHSKPESLRGYVCVRCGVPPEFIVKEPFVNANDPLGQRYAVGLKCSCLGIPYVVENMDLKDPSTLNSIGTKLKTAKRIFINII